jgi:hypothetical protein
LSKFCCVEEGQPVPSNEGGVLDCCHFTARDGVCICHREGETCSAPGPNPYLNTCCDGMMCLYNQCQPPCEVWAGSTFCSADSPCCRPRTCDMQFGNFGLCV